MKSVMYVTLVIVAGTLCGKKKHQGGGVRGSRSNDALPGWSIKCRKLDTRIGPVLIVGGIESTHHSDNQDYCETLRG
jgi:hypothetical protein